MGLGFILKNLRRNFFFTDNPLILSNAVIDSMTAPGAILVGASRRVRVRERERERERERIK